MIVKPDAPTVVNPECHFELRLSAHSLDKFACPWRYYMYRILRRDSSEKGPGLVQGIAGHAASAAWRRGKSEPEQVAEINRVFMEYAAHVPADDYRTPGYLAEIMVQYRAQYGAEGFVWEEVEQDFQTPLGWLYPELTKAASPILVIWTGRRDAVGYDPVSGYRFVFDEKFVSRDESADLAASQNSRALKGYVWSWNHTHPDKPLAGAYLRRVVVRAPTKPKPLNFTLPLDPPVRFAPEVLAEWKYNVMVRAAEIVSKREDTPTDWPMEESICRTTFGCCDYLKVCTMPPGQDRERMLASDSFCEPHLDGKKESTCPPKS